MALVKHRKFLIILLWVFGELSFFVCGQQNGQYTQYNQFGYEPNKQNPYNAYGPPNRPVLPDPGDRDYRTYVFKGRRYGQNNNYNYGPWRVGDPRIQGQDPKFSYDPVSDGFRYAFEIWAVPNVLL